MKQARVVFKYEYIIDTETLGLSEDVSFKAFRKAVDKNINDCLAEIESVTNMVPDEIETDFEGFK